MKNPRFFIAGIFALVVAVGIYVGIGQISDQSTDPAEVMRLAGQAAGVVGGIGVALMLGAFFIKPFARRRRPDA